MRTVAMGALVFVLAPGAHAADLHGVTGFDEFAESHQNIGKALEHRPSLAQDPTYLKRHPGLAHYLHDNPMARTELDAEADEEAATPPPPEHVHREPDARRRRPPSELPRTPRKPDDDDD
jgi:hypothetical protein